MRPRLTATLSTSVLLTALTALPASAAPATITANSGGGGDWTATTTPQLMYSDTQDVYSTSTSGQPVTFAASGGCTVKTIASVAGGLSHAKITGTSGTTPCALTLASAAGNGADAAQVTFTLATIPVGQTAKLGKVMNKVPQTVKVGRTYVLGAARLKHATEAAIRLADELGIDLARLEGSGSEGRITVSDVREVHEA